jgi:hypothetical protein
MTDRPTVVRLSDRAGFRPDLGQLARQQVAAARAAIDATPDEFAKLLSPLLGWDLSPEMVESWETNVVPPRDVVVAAGLAAQDAPTGSHVEQVDLVGRLLHERYSDLSAVYPTRTDFTDNHPPATLFDQAQSIDAVGLSLNLLCQQYPDKRLRALVERGATLRFLFIDPAGDAVKRYEAEEGYHPGQISALTELNIQSVTQRVRSQLPPEAADRLQVAVYDETTRFNLILIDRQTCVMQPYLPNTRGVDSPTFLIHRTSATHGLFPTFEQVFSSLWERGKRL